MKSKTSSLRILALACIVPMWSLGALTAQAGTVDTDGITVCSNATFFGSVIADRAGTPASGLLLYYSFATNATAVADDSGNGNTGTVSGATWTTAGMKGGAYSFDGSDDWIYSPSPAGFNWDDFSVSMCLRYTNGTGYQGLCSKSWDATSGYLIRMYKSGNAAYLEVSGWNPAYMYGYSDWLTWTNGQWYSIAVNINSGRYLTFYRDGKAVGSTDLGAAFLANTAPITIGRDYGNISAEYWNGSIDEVRIYNRSLSAGEVQQLYITSTAGTNTGSVLFRQGIDYVSPLGDLLMGSYTNRP